MQTSELKVMLDLSLLGSCHAGKTIKAGIFRYVDCLFEGLLDDENCHIIPCSGDISSPWYVTDFLAKIHPDLAQNVKYSRYHRVLSEELNSLGDRVRSRQRPILNFLKIKREVVRIILKTLLAFSEPMDSKILEESQLYHSPFMPIPLQVREKSQIKRFLTIHDLIPTRYPHLIHPSHTRLQERAIKSAGPEGWYICNSESTRDDLCEFSKEINPDQVVVTHLAASDLFYPFEDLEERKAVRKKYGIPKDLPFILSVCTLDHRKNLVQVVESFVQMVEQENMSDVHLVLAGAPVRDSEKLYEKIDTFGEVGERIILTDHVDGEDLAALYSDASVFIYISLYEGFGLPLLEAMQCRVPVIASNVSSMPEVVGDAGILVDPMDGDGVCQAMLDLLDNGKLNHALSEKGLEQAKRFSWERCVDETVSTYRKALE